MRPLLPISTMTALLLLSCSSKKEGASKAPSTDVLSEARNAVGAITRGATQAYERETAFNELTDDPTGEVKHELCKSATPVPAKLPSNNEKLKSADSDWGGDAKVGWKCLKFLLSGDQQFQYSYTAGGPYKSKDRGGPDPGPDGFEACAEADFIPGGETTLICQQGTVNKETKSLKLASERVEFIEK